MKKFLKIVLRFLHIIFLIALVTTLVVSVYIKTEFANETVDEFLFYLTNGVQNADGSFITDALKVCYPYLIGGSIIFVGLFYNLFITHKINFISNKPLPKEKITRVNKDKILKKGKDSYSTRQIYPIKIIYNHRIIFTIVFALIIVTISLYNVKVFGYIENHYSKSDLIENNYVAYKDRSFAFPNKKKNLILIVVESLETTFFTKEQGGAWNYEVTPEIYNILKDKDTVFFSSNDKMGGMLDSFGSTWTTASVVSNTTGLPLKTPLDANEYKSTNFMNGSYALGDLLKEQGYYNELISASLTSFGGIKEYFTRHGEYTIIDKDSLSDFGFTMSADDDNYWGFNDNYLFKIAKKRLTEISKEGVPFNETLITIDTHAKDGHVGKYSSRSFPTQLENAYATTSRLIGEFVSWAKKQPFYKDTTIVIIGDHLSMSYDFFKNVDRNQRSRYNAFINSSVTTDNTKNRKATALDTYPTILASLGVKSANDRLGLGVNLFSDKKTLAEEYGLDEMNVELEKNSDFYNKMILGSDYLNMVEE